MLFRDVRIVYFEKDQYENIFFHFHFIQFFSIAFVTVLTAQCILYIHGFED